LILRDWGFWMQTASQADGPMKSAIPTAARHTLLLSGSIPPRLLIRRMPRDLRGMRGAVRGPGLQRWDISLFKNTKIREGMSMQFRAEAFNIFNHTNFDGIRLTRQSGTFGRVISTRDPRIMQLALKFYF
jgi:hypothetical protein